MLVSGNLKGRFTGKLTEEGPPTRSINGEIKRRTNVVGILTRPPSGASSGAILLKRIDEWSVHRRYMPLETMKP